MEWNHCKHCPYVSWSKVRLWIFHLNKTVFLLRSAPEILLSIVGIIFNDFKQDELGPSLIVGSGAFNLLVISAIRNNLDMFLIFRKSDKYFTQL